tara:strand:+ start:2652 stop:3005 length:354 start_codon:yes stop_codon:yes gene_type:complete
MKDVVIDNILRSQNIEDYIEFFEYKDLDSISELFCEDCSLTDWNIGTVKGKKNVMKIYSDIFKNFETIKTRIIHLYEDPDAIICEMILTLDNEKLKVVDIFEFNEEDLIKVIRAYKG